MNYLVPLPLMLLYIEDFNYLIFFLKIPKEIHSSSTITVSFISPQLIVTFPRNLHFLRRSANLQRNKKAKKIKKGLGRKALTHQVDVSSPGVVGTVSDI